MLSRTICQDLLQNFYGKELNYKNYKILIIAIVITSNGERDIPIKLVSNLYAFRK